MSSSFEKNAKQALQEAELRKKEDAEALAKKLKVLNDQIANYPTPIAGCDAQFNFLLEEREKISKTLSFNIDHTNNQKEIDGREGPEPTRYGDWEKKGIVTDF